MIGREKGRLNPYSRFKIPIAVLRIPKEIPMIKMISLLKRKSHLTREQFLSHWVHTHAPLAFDVPGTRRYIQCHLVSEQTRHDIPSVDFQIDGVAELWFDDIAAFEAAHGTAEMKALLADDAYSSAKSKPTSCTSMRFRWPRGEDMRKARRHHYMLPYRGHPPSRPSDPLTRRRTSNIPVGVARHAA